MSRTDNETSTTFTVEPPDVKPEALSQHDIIMGELRNIRKIVNDLPSDRGHTFIIIALWILLIRGC